MKTLYRILSPVFCIAAIPIAIFMPAIRLVITSSLSANIMSTFGIKEYTSIFDLIKMISTADESSSQLFKVIYQIFTAEDSKIADMLTPEGTNAEIEIIYQSLDGLHKSIPNHPGDWYFSGNYPTPGGNKMVNRAFINYYEGNADLRC